MTSCWEPNAPCQVSYHDNPKRKLKWTLERIDMGSGWVGVNTGLVTAVIAEAVTEGHIACLSDYDQVTREPVFNAAGHPKSRFDLKLMDAGGRIAFVEIKNTTLLEDGILKFPDAVTERGRKHLDLLEIAAGEGMQAYILFAANRPEGRCFEVAGNIDSADAARLYEVLDNGVQAIVARISHLPDAMRVTGSTLWTPDHREIP